MAGADRPVAPHRSGLSEEQLQELLLGGADIRTFLEEFAEVLCARLADLGTEVWCGVTLLRDRRATTTAFSAEKARALDEMQHRRPDGPCLTAARTQTMVYVSDTGHDPRWAAYLQDLAGQGVGSVLAVPFELAGEARAALNAYAATPCAFDERVRDFIRSEVRLSSTTLRLAVRMAAQQQTETDMTAAMESRTTIDLAVGIVMGQNRCSQDEAFRILAAASSNRNIKLRDLAAELVATVGRGPATTRFDR